MNVTMKEIAKASGVHVSTVYKVLHGRVGVSDAVRKRVQETINEMGYVPNPSGRMLQRQGITFNIDVLLVEVDAEPYIHEGMRQAIKAHPEYNIQVKESVTKFQDVESQLALLQQSIEKRVDGIILSPNNSPLIKEAIDHSVAEGIPVITVNCDIDDSNRLCYVGQDGRRGARIAARIMSLFLSGEGKIAIITNSVSTENNDFHVRTRETVFRDFLKKHFPGIQVVEYIENFEDKILTYQKTRDMLERIPDLDGIYITCGGVSQVGQALKECGRQDRIKVVCFEDYPEILTLLNQDVVDCTLGGNIRKQGKLSLEILMDYLLFDRPPKSPKQYTGIKVLVKESIY